MRKLTLLAVCFLLIGNVAQADCMDQMEEAVVLSEKAYTYGGEYVETYGSYCQKNTPAGCEEIKKFLSEIEKALRKRKVAIGYAAEAATMWEQLAVTCDEEVAKYAKRMKGLISDMEDKDILDAVMECRDKLKRLGMENSCS